MIEPHRDHENQLRQAISTLEKSYNITLAVLGKALALRHAGTGAHSRRVAAFAIAITRAMHLDNDQVRLIARGAFLHDIGKLAVPDVILDKPGALSSEEKAIMRSHCDRGYEFIATCVPFLKEAAEYIRAHHENYDGSGYSRGLKGEAIPLGARIISVANALDCMTSNQPFRAGQSFDAAREEIQRSSGLQFDPMIVNVFLGMPDNTWSDLRKELNGSDHQAG